jgi:hypothetical protein
VGTATSTKPINTVKNAYLDWRFDQPNDFNLFGNSVTSLAATQPIINQIKASGFNGVVLNVNVPIDPETGKLTLYDNQPGAYNTNKNLPKDTWAVVKAAKKSGLAVSLNFNIVDYHTDAAITSSTVGSGFSTDTFFREVAAYESKIAATAKKNGVSVIGLGHYQFGLDTDAYKDQWQTVVDSVRKNFSGKLTYTTDYRSDNTVWSMVDIVSAGAWTDVNGALGDMKSLSDTYGKPVHIASISPGGGDSQRSNIVDILKASVIDHKNDLNGLAFFEFAPWMQANWLVNPQSESDKDFLTSQGYSNDLYNKDAANAFKNWFNHSTAPVNGSNKNDKLAVYAGDKTVDGGKGVDTVVVLNKAKDCQLSFDSPGSFTLVNNTEGTNKLLNCEYIQFMDTRVSLIGRQDYSQYGWTSW